MDVPNIIPDGQQPTETTALLQNRRESRSITRTIRPSPPLPLVQPVLVQIETKGITSCLSSDFCPYALPSRAAETAFALTTVFYLRQRLSHLFTSRSDVWEQWSREQQRAETLDYLDVNICRLWSDFLVEDRSAEDIEDVLWQSFPFNNDGKQSDRVVDFLRKDDAPHELLAHRLVHLSLLRTWTHGRASRWDDVSLTARLLRRVDAACTPRVLHAMDLSFLLAYLAILAHYLILPPSTVFAPPQLPSPDVREIFMLVYSLTKLLRSSSLSATPYALVVAAFFTHLPSVPLPDDFAYAILLFAFSWVIVELHVPHYPTPLYFLPFDKVLPLMILIWHGVSRIFVPVLVFFLPAIILSLFLLSTSLWDMFPQGLASIQAVPAPLEARMGFLLLCSLLLLLLLLSLGILVLTYPSLSSKSSSSTWDRYSGHIGMEARRAFINVVVEYSAPFYFPPPLNILQSLVQLPAKLGARSRHKERIEKAKMVERGVWRVSVLPLAWAVGGLWLWGLRLS